MRSEQETITAIERYADTVRRICFVHLKSIDDTEDIFQEVFLKYALRSADFEDAAHEKAWLIRVTINACRDLLKSAFRNKVVSLDDLVDLPAAQHSEHGEVLEAVLHLPPKYRDAVYLHYYEGYSAAEIGKVLRKNVNTVYTLLARARGQLKITLGGDGYGK
ncbi:MAG: sigma-70 family RNA polymerase sigma factor [Oscillospiraceae bacterium]|nr:sigma-70 family RNA polymerase sigma factor [Oscillospiraceae bacterium]